MRIIYLLATTLLIHISLRAQTETANLKTVTTQFETAYNSRDYTTLFNLFSPDMQKALPIDKATAFFNELQSSGGNIVKRQFVKYQQSYGVYKTNFERALHAVKISVDSNKKINGFSVTAFTDESLPKLERNTTTLKLPFKEEWTVFWGGDTKEMNYHVESVAQKNAFDMMITDAQGKTYKTNKQTNSNFYAFGKPLLAPCAGEVVLVVDGIKDNKPGELNPIYVPGNTVIIKTANEEFLFFAHFKQHSIKVKQGQKVVQGQLLGLCGNSGNSSEPHLHFHIQNVEDMNTATGVKCYFDNIMVNGENKLDYSPVQKDKVRQR